MKTTCLLLTLLFVIGLTACSKSDDPLPEKVFQDVNKTAEDYIGELNPNLYYNFFRFQNDSDHTLYWGINTIFDNNGSLLLSSRTAGYGSDNDGILSGIA